MIQGVFHLHGETDCSEVKNQMEQTFPLEIFEKRGIPSEAFLFSRFYRNDRKNPVPYTSFTSVMLLGAVFAHETNKHGVFVDVPFMRFLNDSRRCVLES